MIFLFWSEMMNIQSRPVELVTNCSSHFLMYVMINHLRQTCICSYYECKIFSLTYSNCPVIIEDRQLSISATLTSITHLTLSSTSSSVICVVNRNAYKILFPIPLRYSRVKSTP
jgi:hypothetical protein